MKRQGKYKKHVLLAILILSPPLVYLAFVFMAIEVDLFLRKNNYPSDWSSSVVKNTTPYIIETYRNGALSSGSAIYDDQCRSQVSNIDLKIGEKVVFEPTGNQFYVVARNESRAEFIIEEISDIIYTINFEK